MPTVILLSSHSQIDQDWRRRFRPFLSEPERKRLLYVWSEDEVQPGDDPKQGLAAAIDSAESLTAVLFVSGDLVADYIHSEEYLRKLRDAGARVFAIHIRPHLVDARLLGDAVWLGESNRALSVLDRSHQEEGLVRAARQLLGEIDVPWIDPEDGRMTRMAALITQYRERERLRYRDWPRDPLLVRNPGLGQRPRIPFERAFHPLTFVPLSGPRNTNTTDLLTLLQPGEGLLIQAEGGMGKSTWLRACFNQLISREETIPLLLELSTLAARLKESTPRLNPRSSPFWRGAQKRALGVMSAWGDPT